MKQPIILILLFFYLLLFATGPQRLYTNSGCENNLGHVFAYPDSIWRDTSCNWTLNRYFFYQIVDTSWYNEYKVYRSGCDTIFFTCLRCDSVGYTVNDSFKIFTNVVRDPQR